MDEVAQSASRKIAWRLIPFLMLCYFIAYLDRVNLNFAALTFKTDLGLSDTIYGLGAGIFFFGYFIFEVPSNIVLERVGARVWIARIMVTWGILSAAMAFVSNDTLFSFSIAGSDVRVTSFYLLRFLFGVAEAGFFPGVILYLTYWYTSPERARMVGLFMVAIALSGVIGAPLSTTILTNFGGVSGLRSWQWLFILEAIPAMIVGVAVYFYLTDRPSGAEWLTPAERDSVTRRLEAERRGREAIKKYSTAEVLLNARMRTFSPLHALVFAALVGAAIYMPTIEAAASVSFKGDWILVALPLLLAAFMLLNGRILALALIYFGVVTALYGLGFWIAQIVKAFGLSTAMTGWVSAIPYVFSALIMIPWARNSDRTGERVWHVAFASLLGGAAFIANLFVTHPVMQMIVITIGSVGTFAALPTFWSLPTALLTGTAAAAGIALINAIGNLGGFVGPYLVGWIRDTFKDTSLAIASLGLFMIMAGVITLIVGHDRTMEEGAAQPAPAPAE